MLDQLLFEHLQFKKKKFYSFNEMDRGWRCHNRPGFSLELLMVTKIDVCNLFMWYLSPFSLSRENPVVDVDMMWCCLCVSLLPI